MFKFGLKDFNLKLDQFLSKVTDDLNMEGLIPGATNPLTNNGEAPYH